MPRARQVHQRLAVYLRELSNLVGVSYGSCVGGLSPHSSGDFDHVRRMCRDGSPRGLREKGALAADILPEWGFRQSQRLRVLVI